MQAAAPDYRLTKTSVRLGIAVHEFPLTTGDAEVGLKELPYARALPLASNLALSDPVKP